jgi:hypothetical protein
MVDKITVTVHTELTQYGEVIFSVKSHAGIFKRKCLHDALSDADIKMTGIEDIIKSFRRRLKNVEHFAIESKHIRLHDREREESTEHEPSSHDNATTVEVSVPNISVKRRGSSRSRHKEVKHLILECI